MKRRMMERVAKRGLWTAALMVVSVSLVACSDDVAGPLGGDAATVKEVAGSPLKAVTLTADAAKRIDLKLSSVTEAAALSKTEAPASGPDTTVPISGTEVPSSVPVTTIAGGTEIPYSAVLYDPNGHTFAYTKVGELTFVRKAIAIATIKGDVASLTDGPPVGTEVVTVGATELYGVEIGVGDE